MPTPPPLHFGPRRRLSMNPIFTAHGEGLDWEPNRIAFWDNRSTQHEAVSDYGPAKRLMERLTIIGDRPM